MEQSLDLISRRLPELLFKGGTTNPSTSNERVSAHFMHLWPRFCEDVLLHTRSLDLSGLISVTDALEGEGFVVGNELGLTGRFSHNVLGAVTKALSTTEFSNLCFGDVHSANPGSTVFPGVVMLGLMPEPTRPELLAVGELKTFWTLELERFPVDAPVAVRRFLEPHIGQLVRYMRDHFLKYGFLSTYRTTVFVRRISDYRFEVSPPMNETATNPSVRQCFLSLCLMAKDGGKFIESDNFDEWNLRGSALQVSTRASLYRTQHVVAREGVRYAEIGPQSILFGEDDRARSSVTCVRRISGNMTEKAVFEVEFHGVSAIAKCWASSCQESFLTESTVYEKLHDSAQRDTDVLPSFLAYGKIVSSSVFPLGSILVISKVEGEQLSGLMNNLSFAERDLVYSKCRKAVAILRTLPIWVSDSGPHNVLYCRKSKRVTMIDFESVGVCEGDDDLTVDAPELLSIFRNVEHELQAAGG